MELMFEHFPDDQIIFDHYAGDADPTVKDQFHAGEVPFTFLLLKAYTRRPETRGYFLTLISPNRKDFPEHPELLTARIPWKEVADAYHDDTEVVTAVENLVRELLASSIADSSLYACSQVVRTDWVRDQLIARVQRGDKWGLGWIIRALAEGWPDDPAVRAALTALIEPETEAVPNGAVVHLTAIIADPPAAMDRLAEIAPATSNHGTVVNALNSIIRNGGDRHDPRAQLIVERALGSDMTCPFTCVTNAEGSLM